MVQRKLGSRGGAGAVCVGCWPAPFLSATLLVLLAEGLGLLGVSAGGGAFLTAAVELVLGAAFARVGIAGGLERRGMVGV